MKVRRIRVKVKQLWKRLLMLGEDIMTMSHQQRQGQKRRSRRTKERWTYPDPDAHKITPQDNLKKDYIN